MSNKCWYVWSVEDPLEYTDFIFADRPGQAKSRAWFCNDVDYIYLAAKREPKLDGKKPLTKLDIYNAGYYVGCDYCKLVWADKKITEYGAVLCTECFMNLKEVKTKLVITFPDAFPGDVDELKTDGEWYFSLQEDDIIKLLNGNQITRSIVIYERGR